MLLARPLRWLFAGLIVSSAAAAGLAALHISLLKLFLDETSVQGGRNLGALVLWAGGLLLAWLGRSFADFQAKIHRERFSRGIEVRGLELMMRQVLRMPLSFFESTSRGDLLQVLRGDIQSVRNFASTFSQAAIAAFMLLGLGAMAFHLEARLAAIALVLVPIVAVPIGLVGRRIVREASQMLAGGIGLSSALMQMIVGIRIIKAFGREAEEVETTGRLRTIYYDSFFRLARFRALSVVFLEGAAGLAITIVIVTGGASLIGRAVAWPTLVALLMIMLGMISPLRDLLAAYAGLKAQTPAVARVLENLNRKEEVQAPSRSLALPPPPYDVRLQEVSMAFGERSILRNVSLVLKAGETVAIVGRSGSGKTTLLNLLARFFDPSAGSITLGGVDLRDLASADLRAAISIVSQEPFLFSASAHDNIRYGRPEASKEAVVEAARRAQAHDDIQALPNGYDTMVGMAGVPLSGGQVQRLNLARAFLLAPPVLLLDEATSALDSETEAHVIAGLRSLPGLRLVVMVAHRLASVRNADRIVVLKDGAIERVGPFADLLEHSPTFQTLWRLQQLEGVPNGMPEHAGPPEDDEEQLAVGEG